jgi:hypothetical protein
MTSNESQPGYYLAQLNIARAKTSMDDPAMADFFEALDPVNASAEASPGFVWRLEDEDGNATSFRVFDDDRWLVNMSVWESLESLRDFIASSGHLRIMRRRSEWFERLAEATTVLWWVPRGHTPALDEAIARLEHLRRHGPCEQAFGFSEPYPSPGLAEPREA